MTNELSEVLAAAAEHVERSESALGWSFAEVVEAVAAQPAAGDALPRLARRLAERSSREGTSASEVLAWLETFTVLADEGIARRGDGAAEREAAVRLRRGVDALRCGYVEAHLAGYQGRLERLRSLAQEVGAAPSLDEALQRLLEGARDLARADKAGLGLADADGRILPRRTVGLTDEERAELARVLSDPNLGPLLDGATAPLRVAEVREDERFAGEHDLLRSVAHFLGAPIRAADGRQLGALYLSRDPDAPPFGEDDEHLLELLAAHAATIIEGAWLREDAERRAGQLEVLNELARAAAGSVCVQALLDAVAGPLRRLLPFDRMSIVAVDAEGVAGRVMAVHGLRADDMLPPGTRISVPRGYSREVAGARTATLSDPSGCGGPVAQQLAGAGVRSVLHAALCRGDEVLGLLGVASQEPGVYDEEHRAVVEAVADQLAPALRAALLHEALGESEERFRLMFETSQDLLTVADRDGRTRWANPAWRQVLGLTPETQGRPLERVHPEDRERVAGQVVAMAREGRSASLCYRFLTGSGDYLDLETSARTATVAGEELMYVSARDVTDRARTERESHALQDRLRSLASELARAEDRERRRLAVALHDQVGQPLAAAGMEVGALRKLAECQVQRGKLDRIAALVEDALRRSRSLTWELAPPVLYELGLGPALEWLAEQQAEEAGLQATVSDDRRTGDLPIELRVCLFQAARELVTNVARHARARRVDLSLRRVGDEVHIEVRDDGVGFDAARSGAERGDTFGLFGVRERLAHLDGRLDLASTLGEGTTATLALPYDAGASPGVGGG